MTFISAQYNFYYLCLLMWIVHFPPRKPDIFESLRVIGGGGGVYVCMSFSSLMDFYCCWGGVGVGIDRFYTPG